MSRVKTWLFQNLENNSKIHQHEKEIGGVTERKKIGFYGWELGGVLRMQECVKIRNAVFKNEDKT